MSQNIWTQRTTECKVIISACFYWKSPVGVNSFEIFNTISKFNILKANIFFKFMRKKHEMNQFGFLRVFPDIFEFEKY